MPLLNFISERLLAFVGVEGAIFGRSVLSISTPDRPKAFIG
jgi:hypothetical protein